MAPNACWNWASRFRVTGSSQMTKLFGSRSLADDPYHPSLHFKKIRGLWSVRVGRSYRALAAEQDGDYLWFWIGAHAEYDRLIK